MRPRGLLATSLTALSLGLAACSGAAVAPAPAPAAKLVAPSGAGGLRYEVTPRDGGGRLDVVATVPPGLPAAFGVDSSMAGWLRGAEAESAAGWSKVPFDGETWSLSGCEGGCRVRYQYDLAGAAAATDDADYAAAYSGAFVAPPSTWLLRPAAEVSGVPYRFRVDTSEKVGFVTGVFPAAEPGGATYGADLSDLPESPYSAFGRFEPAQLKLATGTLDMAIASGPMAGGNGALLRWVEESAAAVTAYFGRFPLRHAALILVVEDGDEPGHGSTMGNGGGAVVLHVGRETPEKELLHAWQMTHEMVHLAFPNLERRYHWFEEGTATYVETVARARAGAYSPEEAWGSFVRGMEYALPRPGEGGLDDTPTWGRTYWGGALFCLLADLRIREQTGNEKALDDALRAVLEQGGDIGARWDIERVLSVGDRATGTTVLADLHAEMGRKAMQVDLGDLWARLGIRGRRGHFTFDDSAPLAAIRKSMLAPPPGGGAGAGAGRRGRQ